MLTFIVERSNQYKDHSTIVNIRQNALNKIHMDISFFSTDEVTPDKVNSIVHGTDRMSIKLIILASDFLSKPIAKVSTLGPIDKKTDDKHVVSNYRPASLLNGFSKIYEIHLKNHMVSSLNQHISNLASAYRKSYSSQHVFLRLLEKWRKCLYNNYVVGGVLMDLSKAFDCVPHGLLIRKLKAYGILKRTWLPSFISFK